MAIQTFVADTILTAAQMNALQGNDYNQTVSTKTASYTLVAADKGTKVVMNSASATTITVNTSLFSAGDTLTILNIAAGVCTITAGTATVSTTGTLALVQNAGGILYFTSAGVSVFQATGVTASSAGLVQVVPTSVAVTGASSSGSVDANGNVSFTTATKISMNGIFTATYDYYRIIFSLTACSAAANDDSLEARMRVGGTDSSTGVYENQRLEVSGTTVSATVATGAAQWFLGGGLTAANGNIVYCVLDILDPFASKITKITSTHYAETGAPTQKSCRTNGAYDATTSFDGFTFTIALGGGGSVDFTGSASVYGYRK